MTTSTPRLAVLAGGLVLTVGLIAGCGSGNDSSAPAGASGVSALPTSTAGIGNSSGIDAKVCAAIAKDVAAVTKNVSGPATFPGQCAFGGGATTVTFDLNDPQHSSRTATSRTTW